MDHKSKTFGIGGYRGRIIFLGDGSEVLTDSDDAEMFDQEDKDLDSQVSKATPAKDQDAPAEPSAQPDEKSQAKAETPATSIPETKAKPETPAEA